MPTGRMPAAMDMRHCTDEAGRYTSAIFPITGCRRTMYRAVGGKREHNDCERL